MSVETTPQRRTRLRARLTAISASLAPDAWALRRVKPGFNVEFRAGIVRRPRENFAARTASVPRVGGLRCDAVTERRRGVSGGVGGRAPASATKLALAHIAACHGDRALPRGGAEDKLDIAKRRRDGRHKRTSSVRTPFSRHVRSPEETCFE
jgi:hypothetical protein